MRKDKMISFVLSFILIGSLWLPAEVVANAEETSIAVYHEYTTTEEEAIDQWYAVARGVYLAEGTCGITRSGTAKVSVSATTTAHSVCDKVKAAVYLDESTDGGVNFIQIGSWNFSETQASMCHGNKTNISVTSGRRYMARGGHSVTEGSTTETCTSETGSISAS